MAPATLAGTALSRKRRRAARAAASTASPLEPTDGLLGGWSEDNLPEAGNTHSSAVRACHARDVDGRRMRAADRRSCGRTGKRIELGDRVLVQGSGPVGISAGGAGAAQRGASWVGVVGAPEARLEMARRFGADWTIDVTRTTPDERRQAVRDATGGRGPDVVIEASGNPAMPLPRRLRSGARCRAIYHRRSVHGQWQCRDKPTPADQPQASPYSRLLGQRLLPSLAGDGGDGGAGTTRRFRSTGLVESDLASLHAGADQSSPRRCRGRSNCQSRHLPQRLKSPLGCIPHPSLHILN